MKKLFILLLVLVTAFAADAQYYKRKKLVTKEEQLNEQYCSSFFKSTDGTVFDIANDVTVQGFTNILQWLQGRVPGLSIYNTRTATPVPYIRNQRATVYLDEIPISFSLLSSIPVVDIAMVKVMRGPFIGNMLYGSGGAIAIYSLRGEDEEPL